LEEVVGKTDGVMIHVIDKRDRGPHNTAWPAAGCDILGVKDLHMMLFSSANVVHIGARDAALVLTAVSEVTLTRFP